MSRQVYLDYAAATPMDPEVKKAMEPYLSEKFHNPSATYLSAKQVRGDLEKARSIVAKHLAVKASEIIFTAGATEANNLAIAGVTGQDRNAEILISELEHDSVYVPAGLYERHIIPVDKSGVIKISSLKKNISDRTVLVSVIAVSHELGSLQPLKDVSKIIAEVRADRRARNISKPIYLHTDASQAANCFGLNLPKLGVDMASLNGGKIYGPKQSGILYVNKSVRLKPLILGGGQEGGYRAGTENVAASIGFCVALGAAQQTHKTEFERISTIRQDFANQLQKNKIKSVINESTKHRSPHILSVIFPGSDNERLMMELDERGIACAMGSACSADSAEPSRSLKAIGLTNSQARSTLRFSFGRQTTAADVKRATETLAQVLGQYR